MSEQEGPPGAVPPPPGAAQPSGPAPSDMPADAFAQPAQQRRRAGNVRDALASRGAGWVVAAVLAGATVALAAVLATGSSSVTVRPAAAISPAGPPRFARLAGPLAQRIHPPGIAGPVGSFRVFGPGGVTVLPGGELTPAQIKPGQVVQGQISQGMPVSVPPGFKLVPATQVPASVPLCIVPVKQGSTSGPVRAYIIPGNGQTEFSCP